MFDVCGGRAVRVGEQRGSASCFSNFRYKRAMRAWSMETFSTANACCGPPIPAPYFIPQCPCKFPEIHPYLSVLIRFHEHSVSLKFTGNLTFGLFTST